jgi:hypothetical protein
LGGSGVAQRPSSRKGRLIHIQGSFPSTRPNLGLRTFPRFRPEGPGKRRSALGNFREANRPLGADASGMKKNKSNLVLKALARVFLIASPVLFAVSLTGPGSEFLWGFLKPLSALLFVNFFIINLLVTEYARYDEEHDLRLALAEDAMQTRPENKAEPTPAPQLARPTFAH